MTLGRRAFISLIGSAVVVLTLYAVGYASDSMAMAAMIALAPGFLVCASIWGIKAGPSVVSYIVYFAVNVAVYTSILFGFSSLLPKKRSTVASPVGLS